MSDNDTFRLRMSIADNTLLADRAISILARKLKDEGIPTKVTEDGNLLVDKHELLSRCQRYNELFN